MPKALSELTTSQQYLVDSKYCILLFRFLLAKLNIISISRSTIGPQDYHRKVNAIVALVSILTNLAVIKFDEDELIIHREIKISLNQMHRFIYRQVK